MIRGTLFILAVASSAASAHEHTDVRRFVIGSQLAQAGDNAVVFLGDSITEGALLPATICGRTLINAGVGGTTAGSYLDLVLSGVTAFKAEAIVVALGTNDALRKTEHFQADYERLVRILKGYSPTIILAGAPTVGQLLDEDIKSIAGRHSMPFVLLGQNTEGATVDGIHLSPKGYQNWTAAILGAIKSVLRC